MVAARSGRMEFAAMKRRELLELCRQHGLATRGSKADLAASLAGAISGAAAAENVVEVVVGKGCLKWLGGSASGGTSGAAKKVRFALDEEMEERARRRRSHVVLQPVVTKKRGRRKAKKALAVAAVSGRGQQRKCDDVGGDSAYKDVTGKVGAVAPVTQSTMKAMCLCAYSGAGSWNNPGEAEKEGMVEAATDRKQRWKTRENAMVIAANFNEGISRRITRSSSLSSAAVLVYPSVEKKRGRRNARDGKDELGAEEEAAEVQDLTTAAVPAIIKSRSSRNGMHYPLSAQKSPKMLVSCRTTRSSSVAATVILPTDSGRKWRKTRGRPRSKEGATVVSGRGSRRKCVVDDDSVMLAIVTENKLREAEDVHPDGELPADLEVPRIDAPITRSSRNRKIQVYNSVVEETQVGEKIEDKRKPGRPSTRSCWRQQLASSVKEEKQVAASCVLPPLKQSMRNHPEADELISNAKLETNKFCRLPVAKDLKIVHPLTIKAANTSVEDVVTKVGKEMSFTKSSREDKRKNTGGVSFSVDNGTRHQLQKRS